MDNTETTEPIIPDHPLSLLVIDQEGKGYLFTAGKWARFLGVLGFIITAIIALLCVLVVAFTSTMGGLFSSSTSLPIGASAGVLQMLPLLLIMIVYFFVSYFLYQFGTNIKKAVTINDTLLTTKALRNLKSHFKLIGIITIITIVIYALVLIVGGLIFGAFMHH